MYRRFLLTTAHVRRVIIRFEKKKNFFLFFLLLIFYWNFLLLLLLDSRRTCVPNVVNLELFNLAGSGAPGSRHSSEWQPAASDIDFPLFLLFSYSSSSSTLFFGSPASEFNQSNPSVEPVPKGGKVPLSQHRCV